MQAYMSYMHPDSLLRHWRYINHLLTYLLTYTEKRWQWFGLVVTLLVASTKLLYVQPG